MSDHRLEEALIEIARYTRVSTVQPVAIARRALDAVGIEWRPQSIAANKGNFRVTRNCCTSGNCIECMHVTPVGTPVRIVQIDGLSETRAKLCAAKWIPYAPKVEVMP